MSFGKALMSDLNPSMRSLIRICQWLNFGTIEELKIIDGEPVFDPPPRLVRTVKFNGEGMPRQEMDSDDFFLKDCHFSMIAHLDHLKSGEVNIDVKHGLPFGCTYADNPTSLALVELIFGRTGNR